MIGSIIWYNVGDDHHYKTIGLIVGHCENITYGFSVWIPGGTKVKNAIKVIWLKENGLKPKPLNHFAKMMDLENELKIAGYHYLDRQEWYDLKHFKILSKAEKKSWK